MGIKFEEYQKLARLLKEAREILYSNTELRRFGSDEIKKRYKHWTKTANAIDEARNHAEELMFIDYPKQATIYIFYPSSDERLNMPKKVGS